MESRKKTPTSNAAVRARNDICRIFLYLLAFAADEQRRTSQVLLHNPYTTNGTLYIRSTTAPIETPLHHPIESWPEWIGAKGRPVLRVGRAMWPAYKKKPDNNHSPYTKRKLQPCANSYTRCFVVKQWAHYRSQLKVAMQTGHTPINQQQWRHQLSAYYLEQTYHTLAHYCFIILRAVILNALWSNIVPATCQDTASTNLQTRGALPNVQHSLQLRHIGFRHIVWQSSFIVKYDDDLLKLILFTPLYHLDLLLENSTWQERHREKLDNVPHYLIPQHFFLVKIHVKRYKFQICSVHRKFSSSCKVFNILHSTAVKPPLRCVSSGQWRWQW